MIAVRSPHAGLRFGRRASNDMFKAFHEACDSDDLQTADELLLSLEDRNGSLPEQMAAHRTTSQALLKAQARLWSLRCQRFGDPETETSLPQHIPAIQQPHRPKVIVWLAAWLRGPSTRGEMDPDFSH